MALLLEIDAGMRLAVVYVLELVLVVRCAMYELVAALEPESGVKVFCFRAPGGRGLTGSVLNGNGNGEIKRTWFPGERGDVEGGVAREEEVVERWAEWRSDAWRR